MSLLQGVGGVEGNSLPKQTPELSLVSRGPFLASHIAQSQSELFTNITFLGIPAFLIQGLGFRGCGAVAPRLPPAKAFQGPTPATPHPAETLCSEVEVETKAGPSEENLQNARPTPL